MLADFHEMKQKKIKMADSKKLIFSTPPILNIIPDNFKDWYLAKASTWLNLYGC